MGHGEDLQGAAHHEEPSPNNQSYSKTYPNTRERKDP